MMDKCVLVHTVVWMVVWHGGMAWIDECMALVGYVHSMTLAVGYGIAGYGMA
jgi:hypothetical protein